MSAERDTSAASHESIPTGPQAAQPSSPLGEAPVTLPTPALPALLSNPNIGGRGNGPVRQAAILQLQQAQGNRATGRLLQRQHTHAQEPAIIQRQPVAPPVSPADLAKQLQTVIDGATWPEIRKRVYPPQSAAGIQRAKDRKAGKLPDLTGLGRIKRLDAFATAVHGVQKNWAKLATPDERVKALGKAASAQLADANVPAFLIVDKEPMDAKGFFSRGEWKFVINEAMVTGSTLSNADAAQVANTTLHESRHAEQHFLAARFNAGINKKKSADIVAEQGIPKDIADKAVAKKMNASTDKTVAALGKQMYKSLVTDSATNQTISNDVQVAITDLATKRTEAETALSNLKANATPATIAEATAKRDALRAQILVVEQKYALYRNIPHEADAHEVGDAAEQAFKGWP